MQENKLYLQFKDNKKKIEFDLNKNTIFFGNNGKGKTRILQTINSLYQLAKERKKENFSKIIDSMNLDKLKVNGVNYDSLFLANESLKKAETENITQFLRDNRMAFEKLSLIKEEIPVEYLYGSSNKSRVNRIFEYLNKILTRVGSETFPGFDGWLNALFLFANNLRNSMQNSMSNIMIFDLDISSKQSLIHLVDELFTVTSYIRDKYHYFELNSIGLHLTPDLERNRRKIINTLSLKSARYITTDNIDIMNILKKIEFEINVINNNVKTYFWSEAINSDNFKDLSGLFQKRNDLIDKISKFNKIMSKYADIKIKIQNVTELIFLKNSEEMTFDKLSSGERKISFLFLEILLNDVDIYLIDEPELSLSLDYQNKIITDLHVLTKNKTLFIATHAPYIYEDFMAIEGNISKEV